MLGSTSYLRILTSRLSSANRLTAMSRFQSSVGITVAPQLGLIDDALHVRVHGLSAGQKVTLQSYLSDHDLKFIACGHYVADAGGRVDCSQQPSLGGSYDGVESTGLVSFMEQAPGQRPGLRLMKRDASVPYDVHLLVHEDHVDLDTCYERQNRDSYVTRAIFNRTYRHPDVKRTVIRNGRLRGTLYTPPGPGPFPVVIDLFGTAGGLIETRAALLASRGIQTMALAYFAYDDLQAALVEVNLDYFEEAVEFMLSLPNANAKKGVGVVGVSKGAEIALMMAELMPRVAAVVSLAGLYFRSTVPVVYKGQYLPYFTPDYTAVKIVDDAMFFADCFDRNAIEENCVIKVENSNAKFLLIAPKDDGQSPVFCSGVCAERLTAAGKESNFQFLVPEGAGHLVEPPHAPFCRSSYHSKFGVSFYWGGERVAHIRAQEFTWPRILQFLKQNFSDDPLKSQL